MSDIRRWLAIIGIGEDGLDGLSPAARTLIAQASLVVGGRRHLALIADAVTGETLAWRSQPKAAFPAILARRGSSVCVIATGDPFFYGIGSLLAQEVPPEEMICLPSASSFGLAASRLGWAMQDCALITQIEDYPAAKVLQILWVCGRLPENWRAILTALERWGAAQGCTEVETGGRFGWERQLGEEGYSAVPWVTLKKEI